MTARSGGPRRRSTVRLLAAVMLGAALLVGASPAARAADAPGAPGIGSVWTTGAKQGLGTSTTMASKVWYTIQQGVTGEVYYPKLDVPNVQDLQLMVSDGGTFLDLERDATDHRVELIDPRALVYRQVNTARSGRYRVTKTYATDPARSTLLLQVRFEVLSSGPYQVYVLYNPSLANSGMGDTGATSDGMLVASDGSVASALASSSGFAKLSSGYSGTSSDGYQDVNADKRMDAQYDTAQTPGNLVQTGEVAVGADTTFTLALGFGGSRPEAAVSARASLGTGFATVRAGNAAGWYAYLGSLNPPPVSVTGAGLTTQYGVALMTLKAHEDKTFRGASIASLTIPWGDAAGADNCCPAGYHAVWARDLYQVATTQLAAGDAAAANRSLDYLFNVQQRSDGSFPQNTYLDGTAVFGSLQLDEVAFPIILAWHLNRADGAMWQKVKRSADFLVSHGPATPQERWEEEGGYSPSTIAAEIAGLVCAADIARRNGDDGAATGYLSTADAWQRSVEGWTFTTSGHLGDGRYYQRIDDNGNPNDGHALEINNGGGTWDERDVVDGGFLELVRLGVKPPGDPSVAASLQELDQTVKVDTSHGAMWYRYNHDGYGETSSGGPYTGSGIGRLWPLLSGERGEYELANGRPATSFLTAMAGSANPGHLIPEQIWDRADGAGFTFGEGTGSATPLAWSMAQFVRLAVSIDTGRPVETPSVVTERYARR